jgi:hypothetical protein
MSNYLDVQYETVVSSGNNTAATESQWSALGSQVRRILGEAVASVRDGTVSGAVEDFGADWNPKIEEIAQRVLALGGNTTTAANIVNNADADSAMLLADHGAATEASGSQLSRPITA